MATARSKALKSDKPKEEGYEHVSSKYGKYHLLSHKGKYYFGQRDEKTGGHKMPLWSGGGVKSRGEAISKANKEYK